MRTVSLFCLLVSLSLTVQTTSQAETISNPICLSTCVSLSRPAVRVVALNWSATEMLLSLGIEPVGVTETQGYRKWQTNHPNLPEHVVEIGRRQEPNLTEIVKLQPDLIIGYNFRHQRLYQTLNRIAPTLLYQQFPRIDQPDFRYFEHSQVVFQQLAVATGRQIEGEQRLKSMHQTLQRLRDKIAQAGLSHKSIIYGKFVGMGYGLRVFSKQSLAGSVAKALGLDYHWDSTLPGKDFVHLQLEQLPDIKGTHLLLAGDQTESERMTLSPVWSYLPFVQQQMFSQVHPLWSFGGPVSIERMAEEFTASLLN